MAERRHRVTSDKKHFISTSVLKSPHLILKQMSRFQSKHDPTHKLGLGEIHASERQQEVVAREARWHQDFWFPL